MREDLFPTRVQSLLLGIGIGLTIISITDRLYSKRMEQVERQHAEVIDSVLSISGDVKILGHNLRVAQDSTKLYAGWLALCLSRRQS